MVEFCQILLNDFDVSISHLERLIRDLCDSALITQHFIEEEQSIVKEKVSSLSTLTTRLKSSLRVSPGVDHHNHASDLTFSPASNNSLTNSYDRSCAHLFRISTKISRTFWMKMATPQQTIKT